MAYIYDLADTWNNSGVTFTAIKMNVTDTASSASSMLMDLSVNNSSRFSVNKLGQIVVAGTGGYFSNGPNGFGMGFDLGNANVNIFANGFGIATFKGSGSASGIIIGNNSYALSFGPNADAILTRRGIGNLRLGAADAASPVPQILSVQSVVAGTTNGAGANFTITGSQGTGTGAGGSIIFQVAPASGTSGTSQNPLVNVLNIDSFGAATIISHQPYGQGLIIRSPNASQGWNELGIWAGSSDAFKAQIQTNPTTNSIMFGSRSNHQVSFTVNDTARWAINTSGHFTAGADNSYDIGISGARPRSLWAASTVAVGGTGQTQITSAGITFGDWMASFGWSSGTYITHNGAGNRGISVRFGGTPIIEMGGGSSAFPALKRSGATLQVRLADDSAAANLTAARIGAGTENPAATLHVVGESLFEGNLTVTGTTTYMNTATLLVGDNIVVLNADLPNTAPAVESSGIEVNRGSSGNAAIIWDETSSEWDIRANNVTVAAFTQSGSIKANTQVVTGSANTSLIDLATTWNTTANVSAIILNVANTNSGISSNLMDLQTNGISQFRISRSGVLTLKSPDDFTPGIFLNAERTTGIGSYVGGILARIGSETPLWLYSSGVDKRVQLGQNYFLGFNGVSSATVFPDLILSRRDNSSLRLGYFDTSMSSTVTITIASPGVITWSQHFISTGTPVIFSTDGALPTGITAGTTYYAIYVTASTFQIATSFANALAGIAVNTSGSQSGTHTARRGAVAQTFGPQDTLSTSSLQNIDGADFVIRGSRSIGNKPGGSIVFQVSPAGTSGTAQNALATALTIASDRSVTVQKLSIGGVFWNLVSNGNYLQITDVSGNTIAGFDVTNRRLVNSIETSFGWGNPFGTNSPDLTLFRDDAGILAQRNGTNAQTFRIYNTFTDPSNYERARLQWSGNEFRIGTEAAGTGTIRSVGIYSGGTRYQIIGGGYTQFDQNIYMNVSNIVTGGTGFKIGTASTQKIGFWNATPIEQPNTSVTAATVASTGTGDVVAATTTFDGYTIPQIVKALRNAGLLA